ncbi:OLC1v1030747C1 [Oldenlandia corymbosa var. corymbosa]|uniref:OLC1v1030747C1 n=1 Tax=Oldenlandia corymbosa var. corymbosa TaxID=529605 RepID=A0AAV1CGP8_OLDCO|nr:OLC1v1030747C1 [Oldenlandia corymbosa var. corymbosa]
MLTTLSSTKSTIFVPQSPFLDSTKTNKCYAKFRKRKCSIKASIPRAPLRPFRFCFSAAASDGFLGSIRRKQIEVPSKVEEKENHPLESLVSCGRNGGDDFPSHIAKVFIFTVVSVFWAFSIPVGRFSLPPAMAATGVLSEVFRGSKKSSRKQQGLNNSGHLYSHCTERLLEVVSGLLKTIEEVRKGDNAITGVEAALKEVKNKKTELQNEIMERLYAESRVLRGERWVLMKRSEEILEGVSREQREQERLKKKVGSGVRGEGVKDKIAKLEENMINAERDYNDIWERIGEIDDHISKKETLALSIGVRELSFIERECEQLVEGFLKEVRQSNRQRVQKSPPTHLSRSEIKRELQSAERQLREQIALTNILENEDLEHGVDAQSFGFAQRLKQSIASSKNLQQDLENRARKNMKKYGEEKRFVVTTPLNEVVKGFPEIELKWMFGNREVVVPKAVSIHLFHGWKKWREEAKANLKQDLLEKAEVGKKYVAERQGRILLARDRVTSRTWRNDEKKRWEMDPIALPYAVSKKLVRSARIRHDWGALHVLLKGDEREYYVDIKEYDLLFEDFGGFDELYMRMLASDIPTVVQLMWIPFSELDFHQQFLVVTRLSYQCLHALWNTNLVSRAKDWTVKNFRQINDDLMMMIGFPLVEFIIPYSIRMRLGMAWPEYVDQSVASTWYLKWQSEAEMSFRSGKTDELEWYLWFLIRSVVYGFICYHVFRFMRRNVPGLLGFGPLRRDPNLKKLQRVKTYIKAKIRSIKQKKRDGVDPISTAFDGMKRVKNPPIRLKDFASVESMREEINEVVSFLQNPRAFQEMGARAPRGVLIVGERGTGKTSLALAIAAEAKVPVVEVKAQQLEAGLWVGQSASNVRELFQTARDLAPVIIFVEDFDLFAGVRGKFIHTKKQDHEAFINQLLVELDGFEKQEGVVLMATTRNLKQIDEALQRPGRMDRIFRLQRPTQAERERILQLAAKETMDEELVDFVDWGKVAEKTALLRPIELKLVPLALEGGAFRRKLLDTDELMSYCSWFASFSQLIPNWVRKTTMVKKISKLLVNHLGLTLTKEDLENVVDLMEPYGQISNGIELLNPPLEWTNETKMPHAVWASGRGLIAFLLPNFDVVDNLWLEPLAWEGIGCTKITKARNEGSLNGNVESRAYVEKRLVFCFGSYIASQMLLPFGEENLLSSSELQKAQEIATRMVLQYGWGPDDSPTIYHHGNAETVLSMGNNFEYEMAAKVEKMYYLAFDKAKAMLQRNRIVLEKIVEELLEYEILTGKDIARIFAANNGIREEEPFSLSGVNDTAEPVFQSLLENGNSPGSTILISSN